MRGRSVKCIVSMMLSVFILNVNADTSPERIGKAQYKIHQIWALSKNYYYGTTLPKDKMMALAWQLVYTSLLPKSYPGMSKLVETAKSELSDAEVNLASNKAIALKNKFNLDFQLTERELFSAFHPLNKNTNDKDKAKDFEDMEMFLDEVKAQYPELASSYREKIQENDKEEHPKVILYGQVIVNGAPPVQEVSVNQSLDIDKGGYFLMLDGKSPLVFQLSGFKKRTVSFSPEVKEANISRVYMNELEEAKKASIVGSIAPEKAVNDINIVLVIKDKTEKREAFFNPLEPVTLLPSGQFYAKGLSPTKYELIISYHDKIYKQAINLQPGMVKNLPQKKLLN